MIIIINSNSRIEQKEKEKVDKYQDLKSEFQKLWNRRVKVVPIIIGVLGTPPKDIKRRARVAEDCNLTVRKDLEKNP